MKAKVFIQAAIEYGFDALKHDLHAVYEAFGVESMYLVCGKCHEAFVIDWSHTFGASEACNFILNELSKHGECRGKPLYERIAHDSPWFKYNV